MRGLVWVLLLAAPAGCRFDPFGVDRVTPDAAVDPPDGQGPPVDAGPPAADASPCAAKEVFASSAHTCALRGDGVVWCWGLNAHGEVGFPASDACSSPPRDCNPRPAIVPAPPAATLGLGDRHTCMVGVDGQVFCWGDDAGGQFGDGNPDSSGVTPVMVTGLA